jgi:hypothetical protein
MENENKTIRREQKGQPFVSKLRQTQIHQCKAALFCLGKHLMSWFPASLIISNRTVGSDFDQLMVVSNQTLLSKEIMLQGTHLLFNSWRKCNMFK